MRDPETRAAVARASSSATDDLWRRSNEARARARAEESMPFDADCRFGAVDGEHRCADSFGARLRPNGSCWYEANARMSDQARRERALAHYGGEAEKATAQCSFADAAGLATDPPCLGDGT